MTVESRRSSAAAITLSERRGQSWYMAQSLYILVDVSCARSSSLSLRACLHSLALPRALYVVKTFVQRDACKALTWHVCVLSGPKTPPHRNCILCQGNLKSHSVATTHNNDKASRLHVHEKCVTMGPRPT